MNEEERLALVMIISELDDLKQRRIGERLAAKLEGGEDDFSLLEIDCAKLDVVIAAMGAV